MNDTTTTETLEAIRALVVNLAGDPVPVTASTCWAAIATWARVGEAVAAGRAEPETVELLGRRARELFV